MAELRTLLYATDDERIAEALPRAVAMRIRRDRSLAIALEPLLADTLRDVAARHPDKLVDALRPIIGQAVGRAVSGAFAALMQRLNQALQHTFSLRSLRWRLEAARTGRPFAEVVLLHSLVFRVEQVFLIHRRTGILLAHAAATPKDARDPDQVAAMLNVIEKFVHDAFREGQTLTRFEVGDLQGRCEIGAEATLTAVVRGTPPEDLSIVLREALERIQLHDRWALLNFHGDTTPFSSAEEILAGCLLGKKTEQRHRSVFPILALAVVVALIAVVARGAWRGREATRKLQEYATALREQPGIILTEVKREGDRFVFVGLRDPLAPQPADALHARGLDPSRATFRLEPFFSLDGRLVEPRVRATLAPPPDVALIFEPGVVRVLGIAPREWLLQARAASGILPGIARVDTSHVREREAIVELREARERMEQTALRFPTRVFELAVGDQVALDSLARDGAVVLRNAAGAGVRARFRIDGFADPVGSAEDNRTLSRARAEALAAALAARGLPSPLLEAEGQGESPELNPTLARRAVVHVLLEGAP